MSITPEAIQKLVDNGNIDKLLNAINSAGTQSSLAVLPNSYSIENLEKYMPQRDRLRGHFQTASLDEFSSYNKQFTSEDATTFVDSDNMTAKTIFDLGQVEKPLHKEHLASISLKRTAPFKALLACDGEGQSQKELAEWLEDYSEYLIGFGSDGEVITMDKAIPAVRTLKFEVTRGNERSVDNFSAEQSEYERMATTTRDSLVIPVGFRFKCIPYVGLDERSFELRLSIVRNEVLTLRIKLLEELEEKMAEEFKDKLTASFTGNQVQHPIYIGKF